MADSKPKVYISSYCPFAQRVWISFLAKKVDFEFIETNPNIKSPEWLAISPTGLVPVIVHNGNTVYESAICVQYVDEAFASDVSILPSDPFKRAYSRIWGDFLGKITSHFFNVLKKTTKEEQEEEMGKYLAGLQKICDAMDPDGPFFASDTLGYVDICLAPFGHLVQVLTHYRGVQIPDSLEFARYHKWWRAVKNQGAVAPTLLPIEKLLPRYDKYITK